MRCPRDHNALVPRGTSEKSYYLCSFCGGILVDLQLQAWQRLKQKIDNIFVPSKTHPSLLCPRCDQKMNVFYERSGAVEVDRCSKCHSYWMDHGELSKIDKEPLILSPEAEYHYEDFINAYVTHESALRHRRDSWFRYAGVVFMLMDIVIWFYAKPYGHHYHGPISSHHQHDIAPHFAAQISLFFAVVVAIFPTRFWYLLLVSLYFSFVGGMTVLALRFFN